MPHAAYGRIWTCAVCATLVMLGGAEWYLRRQGHVPSVTDDLALWAHERSKVYETGGKRALVLLGASRIQLGVVPAVLERHFPQYRVVCLAVDGHGALTALKDLAEDEKFNGVILCGESPVSLIRDDLVTWTNYYRKVWGNLGRIDRSLNLKARLWLQERFVVCGFWANFKRQLGYRYRIPLNHVVTFRDRHCEGWFHTRMSSTELRRRLEGRTVRDSSRVTIPEGDVARFEADLSTTIQPLVAQLRARGADVVFLHMPQADGAWELRRYPRALYWDKIEKYTGATALHYRDYSTFVRFDCPDGSHLDAVDATPFTEALAELLPTAGLSTRRD